LQDFQLDSVDRRRVEFRDSPIVNSKLLLLIMSVAERQGGTPQAYIEEKLSAYATVKNGMPPASKTHDTNP
jgi:hypothetical protein